MFSFQVNCRYVSFFLLIKLGKLQCSEKVFAPFLNSYFLNICHTCTFQDINKLNDKLGKDNFSMMTSLTKGKRQIKAAWFYVEK